MLYLVLKGTSNFYKNESYKKLINPIEIVGKTNEKNFLENQELGQWPPWSKKIPYSFDIKNDPGVGLPIQIVPSLISESNDWSLQFFLQTNPHIPLSDLSYPRITKFKLRVLDNIKGVENQSPFGKAEKIFINDEDSFLQVIWENIDLDWDVKAENYNKYLYVRFENSISIKPHMLINGEVEVQFDGALSGLDRAIFFSPLGNWEEKSKTSFVSKFKVKIRFEFNLKTLKLYKTITKTQEVKKDDAIPESEAITRLVNVLSENDYYVQRVIENLPGASSADARIIKRLWIISGHYYLKKQPINFRIVAKGIEQYDKSDEPYDGKTDFNIVVRGVVSNTSMEDDLVEVQSRIVELVQQEPQLSIEWLDKNFNLGVWEEFRFKLKTTGGVPINQIYYSITGPSVKCAEKIASVEDLPEEGGLLNCSIKIFFREEGDVPIVLQVVCKDGYGKFAPRKWQQTVKVGNIPSFGRQNFINKLKPSPTKFQ